MLCLAFTLWSNDFVNVSSNWNSFNRRDWEFQERITGGRAPLGCLSILWMVLWFCLKHGEYQGRENTLKNSCPLPLLSERMVLILEGKDGFSLINPWEYSQAEAPVLLAFCSPLQVPGGLAVFSHLVRTVSWVSHWDMSSCSTWYWGGGFPLHEHSLISSCS